METIDIFRNSPNARDLAAGAVLFTQGDPSDVMYAVVSGRLGVTVNGTDVATCEPGQVVGEMALIDRHRPDRTATVTALTDTVVVPIDEDEFKRLVHRTPFFALQLLRIVADRLAETNTLL